MFFNRLKWFAILMTVVAGVIVLRLIDIQVVRAGEFEQLADRMLTRPAKYLAAPRGAIVDRDGRQLVIDQPSSDVAIHYALIRSFVLHEGAPPRTYEQLKPETQAYLRAVARERRRDGQKRLSYDELADAFAGGWQKLGDLTGTPPQVLLERAGEIDRRVQRLKRYIQQRNDTVRAIREEHELHPIVRDASTQQTIELRMALGKQRWLQVLPGGRRNNLAPISLAHLLGRLGPASAKMIADDSLREDELRGLRARDLCGWSGVERLGEQHMRGTRGRIAYGLDGQPDPSKRLEPIPGKDLRLTIDTDLQEAAYEILGAGVEASPHPCGGAAVVLDARTREVLALVSYPSYDATRFREDYNRLRADLPAEPLRFRAIQNRYPPGSTCKVISLYGALADQVLRPESTVLCDGPFRKNNPNAFRCWIYNKIGISHGPRQAVTAIRDSCNPYFYTAGDKLGGPRLSEWFRTFGLGQTQGTGLIEETRGLVPTEDWLAHNRRSMPRYTPADAWNFSIGQGEIAATPLQAANVAATMATGDWAPVRLLLSDSGAPLPSSSDAAPKTFRDDLLRTIRQGMFEVVNDTGTAKEARLQTPGYELCGKTGSAQTPPSRVAMRWTFEWADGSREERIRPAHLTKEEVLREFDEPRPEVVGRHTAERYPMPDVTGGKLPAHAWFIGYTQRKSTRAGAAAEGRSYAIAVIIEYGGSGGTVAGPVVRDIADYLLGRQQEWGRLTPAGGVGR